MYYDTFPLIEWYKDKSTTRDISESGISNRTFSQYLVQIGDSFVNAYGDISGNKDLLDILASIYHCDREGIVITNGATEAVYIALEGLLQPSDELIIITPYYNNIHLVLQRKRISIVEYMLDINNPEACFEKLLKSITNKTKAVLFSSISNPSGYLIPQTYLKKLLNAAYQNNCYLIIDDVFAEFNIEKHAYLLDYSYLDKVIHINSLAKVYGAPGLRIGWIITNPQFACLLSHIKSYISENSPAITQSICVSILKDRKRILAENDLLISENIQFVRQLCNKYNSISMPISSESCFCTIAYRTDISSHDLCSQIYKDTKILLAPGGAFGYENCFRLGFGINKGILLDCLCDLEFYFKTKEVCI